MAVLQQIQIPDTVLSDFCCRWKIVKLQLLGPVFPALGSDVSLVATFAPDAEWSLLDHVQMEHELGERIGHKVDLLSRGTIDAMKNVYHRNAYIARIGATVYGR